MFKKISTFLIVFSFNLLYSNQSYDKDELTILEAEAIALKHNQNLAILRQQVDEKKMAYYQKISAYFPSLSYEGEVTVDQYQNDGHRDSYDSTFTLDQEIYSTDKIFSISEAKLDFESQKMLYEEEVNNLLLKVRKAYYNVVLNKKNIDVAREEIELLKLQLEKELETRNINLEKYLAETEPGKEVEDKKGSEKQKSKDAELVSDYEVNQVKVRLSDSHVAYHEMFEQWNVSQSNLIRLLGLDLDTILDVKIRETELPLQQYPIIKKYIASLIKLRNESLRDLFQYRKLFSDKEERFWRQKAIENRPVIKYLNFQEYVAEEKLNAQKAKYLPSLSAQGEYKSNTSSGKGFIHLDYEWSYGVTLSWNLFDSFNREFGIQKYVSKKLQAQMAYENGVQDTYLAVRNAFQALDKSLQNYLSALDGLQSAKLALEEAKEKLAMNQIGALDYRESVFAHTKTLFRVNTASFNVLTAYFELEYLGGAYANNRYRYQVEN